MEIEINEVYNKVDEMFQLKLKSQIKGSGLVFKKFLHVDDLVKEKNYYLLIVNDKGLKFNDITELYDGLIGLLHQELDTIKKDIEELLYHKQHDLVYDKINVDYELDRLGYRESRLYNIIEQIEKK